MDLNKRNISNFSYKKINKSLSKTFSKFLPKNFKNKLSFDNFIIYLWILRWSRLLGYIFAFICLSLSTYYFAFEQSKHVKTHWEFKNYYGIWTGDMDMEAGKTYKVKFNPSEGYPQSFTLNDDYICLGNYYQYCPECWWTCHKYIKWIIRNPFRIRANQKTNFSFQIIPKELGKPFGWFPVAHWSVDLVDESDKEGMLFTDTELQYLTK